MMEDFFIMGFFSWACPACEKSVLSPHATRSDVDRGWYEATSVSSGGSMSGVYDGYGRLEIAGGAQLNLNELEEVKLYHTACYKSAGKPGYDDAGLSPNAKDQGFFIDPENYIGCPG